MRRGWQGSEWVFRQHLENVSLHLQGVAAGAGECNAAAVYAGWLALLCPDRYMAPDKPPALHLQGAPDGSGEGDAAVVYAGWLAGQRAAFERRLLALLAGPGGTLQASIE